MNRREALRTLAAGSAAGAIAGGMAVMATPSATAAPIGAGLALAIERHRAALAGMEASGKVQEACERALRTLETPDTRSAFDAADDAFTLDCGREAAAHNRVIAAPIVTLADMRAKASYLASVSRHMIHDGNTMATLLASMGGESSGTDAAPTADPMREAVEEYEAAYALQGELVEAEDWKACEAIYAERIGPAEDLIHAGPTVTTLAGAIAAVRYVATSENMAEEGPATALRAVLAYLDGRV